MPHAGQVARQVRTSAGVMGTRRSRVICATSSTEYGVADLRGKSDKDVIAAMLSIADSRFQPELVRAAKDSGKLPRAHEIPAAHRENIPDRIARALEPMRARGLIPPFPFGTDFSPVEQRLIPALELLKDATSLPLRLAGLALSGLSAPNDAQALSRMGFDNPGNFTDRIYKLLLRAALARTNLKP